MDEENSFLGVGWSFPPEFDLNTLETNMSGYEQDIKQSLTILLSTSPGERIMHPQFGCNLRQFVYEEISQSLFSHIEEVVRASIIRYEARIDLENVQLEYDDGIEGILYITLFYKIRQTNSRHNMVYPFYLLEGNNISSLQTKS